MAKGTKYSQQFKEDAVQYRLDHPELPLRKAAENLGVSESALKNWMKAAKEHKVIIPYDSYHESQITIPTIRGNRTSNTLFSSTCKVADAQ